jgi:chromosome segregation ATPase
MSDPAVTAEQAQASYRALEASIAEQLSGAETAEPYVPAIADPGEDLIEARHGLDVATIGLANARAAVDLCRGHLSEAESELATAARAVESEDKRLQELEKTLTESGVVTSENHCERKRLQESLEAVLFNRRIAARRADRCRHAFSQADEALNSVVAAAAKAARVVLEAEVRADHAEFLKRKQEYIARRERLLAARNVCPEALTDREWGYIDQGGIFSAAGMGIEMPLLGSNLWDPDFLGGDPRPSRARVASAAQAWRARLAELERLESLTPAASAAE